ncbi:DUF6457 domain-containing protein [Nocardioides sp. GY 10127]|uniref:DUF6457 domain-containing protein n=1 Tax=Nocardioides sp. GY 10127 TaxID=2569762 RepID=UPI00197FABE6|nr:DUF6457 domain-containing protein [Nocardioides sp. GY 10127]
MNLHDWIDEVCDALDLEAEIDEGLVLDLARVVAHNVTRPAAPLTAYLLGLAVGAKSLSADPEAVEDLADRVSRLAESWDRPAPAGVEDAPEEEDELDDELDADEEE